MAEFNLENFPASEAGRRMLTYVTEHWYDNSYVGKWVYEVMGQQLDVAVDIVEDLANQLFVDTATWGMFYHEQKYGLPMQPANTDYEARRKLIREKRDTKAPMTPWRMEQVMKSLGYDAHVHDINDPGYTFSHPNYFSVQFDLSDDDADLAPALKKMDAIKQSHTFYRFSALIMLIESLEQYPLRWTSHIDLPWWTLHILDGSFLLDGSVYLNSVFQVEFSEARRVTVAHSEDIHFRNL